MSPYYDEDQPILPRYDTNFVSSYESTDAIDTRELVINDIEISPNSLNNDNADTDIDIQFERETSGISRNVLNVILALLTIVFTVGINVSLPIYAGTMDYIGADAYVLLSQACPWFVVIFVLMTQGLHYLVDSRISLKPTASFKILFIMGTMATIGGILNVYASPPDRTPPYLQGLLATSSIPFTLACRLIWMRKGINVPRFLCVGTVMVGLFITAMPQLWGLPGSGSGTGDVTKSTLERVLWPLCFTIGFLPYGIMNVICEKELKKGEGQSFSFITWTQIFQMFTMYMMFWSDFIPGFGMSDSPSALFDKLHRGWECSFSSDASCNAVVGKAWMFYIAYCLGNLFQFLLIQYAEGAVYAAVVQACISPLAALFWTLFKFDVAANHFYWKPELTETTGFTSVGVCLIIPGVVLYNYFSIQEEKEKAKVKAKKDLRL